MTTVAAKTDYRALLKDTLHELDRLQKRVRAFESAQSEPIAVIGMGCRFPGGADDPEGYWRLLHDGRAAIREVPPERWDVDEYYDPDPETAGKMYTRFGAFLDVVDGFEPEFFGISPREAASIDPQQRLLLEVTWEALEQAGIAPDSLYGSNTGTFIGISNFEFATRLGRVTPVDIDGYFGTGGALSAAAGRLAFAFGLTGPAVSVDTACSSSLVTIHQACQALRAGECELAIGGGVNLIFAPEIGLTFCSAGMLAADGRCKTFDASADGFVRGEGCGVVVLARLSDALAARHPILALIRGSCVNQDGASGGLTVPSGPSQEAAVRGALARAGITPDQVGYIEAHGTGTSLGDPIEIGALAQVFGRERSGGPLLVGSVKTNIGHLEGAAGVAGLIKVILSLQRRTIPPHLNLVEPNPHIPWARIPVAVATEPVEFPARHGDRVAGISGFGFTGTNAHLVVSEAPAAQPETRRAPARPMVLLPLSGKSEPALRELTDAFAERLADAAIEPAALADLCFTAQTGRVHHRHRLALAAGTREELLEALRTAFVGDEQELRTRTSARVRGRVAAAARPRVGFLFAGQGVQAPGMGATLYASEPVFRATLDACAEILAPLLERPLLEVMHPADGDRTLLDRTDFTQPAVFALECALADLWRSWGIVPEVVLGHSFGEYAAAYCAGVFDLEQGCRLIAARGHSTYAAPGEGSMLILASGRDRVAALVDAFAGEVVIAAENGPESTVVSGPTTQLDALARRAADEGLSVKPLRVSHAFHSPMMEPALAGFGETARTIEYRAPRLTFISTLLGDLAGDEVTKPDYWSRQIVAPVRFGPALARLETLGCDHCVELGPRPTLIALGRSIVPDERMTWLPSMRSDEAEHLTMFASLARLYVGGAELRWSAISPADEHRRIALPTNRWQRRRHWLAALDRPAVRAAGHHPLLGDRLRSPLAAVQFETCWSESAPAYLADHRVFGRAVVPTAAYLEIGLAAGRTLLGEHASVEALAIEQPLVLPPDESRVVQTVLVPERGDEFALEVMSMNADDPEAGWTRHARARVVRADRSASERTPVDLDAVRERLEPWTPDDFYATCTELGVDYGPSFRGIRAIWRGPAESFAAVELPGPRAPGYAIHPSLLDACMQVLAAGLGEAKAHLPIGVERFVCLGPEHAIRYAHARIHDGEDGLVADIHALDEHGSLVAAVLGCALRQASRATIEAMIEANEGLLYDLAWPASEASGELAPAHVLLAIHDGRELWRPLADELRAREASCSIVRYGPSFAQLGPDEWRLNPDDPSDWRSLWQALDAGSRGPVARVIELSAIEPTRPTEEPAQLSDAVARTGARVLSWVGQLDARARETTVPAPTLWVVTRGARVIDPAVDPVRPSALVSAPLWGLGQVLALEHPRVWGGLMDLDARHPELGDDAARLALEFLRDEPSEDQLAFRAGRRHAARLIRTRTPKVTDERSIEADRVYLITGGLGFLGRALARWLIDHGARRLCLLGRRGLAREADDPNERRRIAELDALRRDAEVEIVVADVGDSEQMDAVFAGLSANTLAGVFHLAGVSGTEIEPALALTPASTRAVLHPKVAGAWNLHRLLHAWPDALFVMFSSASAVWGGRGQASYAAANQFLDSLAWHRRGLGRHALSVDWGVLGGAGGLVTEAFDRWLAQIGLTPIDPREGFDLLWRLIAGDRTQATVARVDWARFGQVYGARRRRRLLDALVPAASEARLGHALGDAIATKAAAVRQQGGPTQRAALTDYLRASLARTLGSTPAQIDPELPLSALGLDSLMAVELKNRLRTELDTELPIVAFLEEQHLDALTERVWAAMPREAAGGSTPDPTSATGLDLSAALDDPEAVAALLSDLDQISEQHLDSLLESLVDQQRTEEHR